MQSELKRVSAQAARAARAAEEAARAQQAQRGDLEALRRHVAGLERQVRQGRGWEHGTAGGGELQRERAEGG